jgi:outer membrane protein assembly factor BamB
MNHHLRRLPVILVLASCALHATPWPQYRGPNGDGSSSEKIVAWPVTGPKQVWKVASPNGFSSFAVADGRAFTLEGREPEGVKQEVLVARDAATGKELWVQPVGIAKYDGGGDDGSSSNKGGDGPRSSPAVAGNAVIVMNAQFSLEAFDVSSGKSIWKRDLIKEHSGPNLRWGNAASPVVDGGVLYVAGGGSGQTVLALNPADGAVITKAFDEKVTHATPTPATLHGQRQIIFFFQSGLLAVEPQTLKELWRYKFPYRVSSAASPVVSGDIVYCSAGYGVGAGAVRVTHTAGAWQASEVFRVPGDKELANHWSTPVASGGHLYGMFQFKQYGQGPIKCVDLSTGTVKWERPGFGPGNVVLAGDKVIALSDTGELVVFEANPEAYKEVARAKVLEGKCWTTPVLSDGRIYARSTKEAVCLELSGK